MPPLFRMVFNAAALLALLGLAWGVGTLTLARRQPAWESLALGRQIAEAGTFPDRDGLLFTARPGDGFDADSWAWGLPAWWSYRAFGVVALRVADALAWALCLLALAATAFRRGARPFSTAVFTAWGLAAALPDLKSGPSLAVFALFCLGAWLLEARPADGALGRRLALPPLAMLAANMSPAAWTLAPLALGGGAVDESPRPNLVRITLFLAVGAGLCLCPLGPLKPLQRATWAAAGSPLLPANFEARQAALLLLVVAAGLWAVSSGLPGGRARRGQDAWMMAVFTAAALADARFLPYASAVAVPLGAARLDLLTDALPAPLRLLRWPAKMLALAALPVALLRGWPSPLPRIAWPVPNPCALPSRSVAFYRRQLLDEDILCPADWTPWLALRLAPHARFALDPWGRADPARAALMRACLDAAPGWEEVLRREGVGLCWLRPGSPLALAMSDSQAWQPVRFDDASVVFVSKSPAHASLIHDRAPRGLRPGDPAVPFEATRLAEAEADLEADLARDPDMGVLYLDMARLWLARGRLPKSRETLEGGIRADPAYAPNYALLSEERAALGRPQDLAAAAALMRQAVAYGYRPRPKAPLAAAAP